MLGCSYMFVHIFSYYMDMWICHLNSLCVCEDMCENKRIQISEYLDIKLMSPLSPITKQIWWSDIYLYIYMSYIDTYGIYVYIGFPGGSDGKEAARNARDLNLIPGLGWSPWKGNGNPLQFSCLENSMHRGSWGASVSKFVTLWGYK